MKVHISVVIPAHNEEKYIKRCIDSIKYADSVFPGNTEIIVVCNRCTDHTADIAKENGAVCAESLLQLQVCTVGFFGLRKKPLIELEDLPIKKRWKMLLPQNSLENMERRTASNTQRSERIISLIPPENMMILVIGCISN